MKWGLIVGVWCVIVLLLFTAYCSVDLPDVKPLIKTKDISIEVLYSNGKKLKEYGSYDSEITNYAEFPLHLVDALIATEDHKFFKHGGLDYFGILRAFLVNLKSGYSKQGGSTITQQLSKILLQNHKKTIKRKVQELLLSFQLEKYLTKEEILMTYLNKSYFGAGKYGIKSASRFYFSKPVTHLSLEESAMLVGLLKAPSKYSPQNNPELSKQRTKQVLLNMENMKLISAKDYNPTTVIDDASGDFNSKLNEELYFADWIRAQAHDYTDAPNITVRTTLTQKMQTAIENAIMEVKPKNQVAVVAIDKNGAIIGMAGGTNYHRSEFNRAVYGSRQAGSSFKLFVYLAGMVEKNFTPNTTFKDEPVAVGSWFPENNDGKYYGNISMRDSFAKSLNSVSIQISEASKVQNVAKMAKRMGITSTIDRHDPTIALGTTEVNLIELTSSYAVIINGGQAVIPYSIAEIKNADDNNVIYERKTQGLNRILDEKVVENMREMLRSVVKEGTGKRAYISGVDMGGKTGTTQNNADAWFIGYIGDVVIGVWTGNDDNSSMGKNSGGGYLPAILWKAIAKQVIDN
jgi:penicillin-binding protein 1A